MHYLFVSSDTICKWCAEPLIQILSEEGKQVVVKLCPNCDRWPKELLENGYV